MKASNLIIIVLSAVLIVSVIFFASQTITSFATNSPAQDNSSVKIATFAVCEKQENYTYCKDKLFASCNKALVEINGTSVHCNGKEYNVDNSSLGETYHPSNWEDPRPSNFITAWAASE